MVKDTDGLRVLRTSEKRLANVQDASRSGR